MTSVDLTQFGMAARRRPRLLHWPAFYAAAALFLLDAFIMGQGMIAAAILLGVAVWLVPKAALFFAAGRNGWPTTRLALLLAATAVAIMLTINLNNTLAQQRAQQLIAAIEIYRAASGRYPPTLDALVPGYIDTIPQAKYTLTFNRFLYLNRARRVSLAYVDVPPFGRPSYDFANRRWGYSD